MKPRHIHLIGICGTAMASLAGMLKQRGFHVTGSDVAAYPPMSDFLAGMGIEVSQPFAEANLNPRPDLVVIGNALSRGNVEVEYVLDQRLPFTSMAALVQEEFLRGKEVLTVAGTHGKTTTTSMLAWIFHVAGRRPSFLIGGIAENFGSSFAVSEGGEFILEGDEYDTAFFDKGPKFMHYFPDGLILTSVEFDHADIYRSLDEIKTAFKRLVNLVPRRGRIIAWDEQGSTDAERSGDMDQDRSGGSVSECVSRAFCTVERYGFAEDSAWRIRDVRYEPQQHHLARRAPWPALGRVRVRAGGRVQRLERHRRRRARCRLRHRSRNHWRGPAQLPQREAAPGSESRDRRNHRD